MKTAAIFPNPKQEIDFSVLDKLFGILYKNDCAILMSENYRDITENYTGVTYIKTMETGADSPLSMAEMIIVLGGDGSILGASKIASVNDIPILGINLGHVGYMAELEIHEIELAEKIIKGEIKAKIEERIMLDVSVEREGEVIYKSAPALNDAILSNGPVSRLISFNLFCDGSSAGNYRADGMIVATPTGSTAYSMSAGGPVLDPCLDSLCVTPICSHSLMSRPVVFKGNSVLELKNMMCRDNKKYLTVDGRDSICLEDGDVIKIQRSEYVTKLIRVKDGGFLNTLRIKMSE